MTLNNLQTGETFWLPLLTSSKGDQTWGTSWCWRGWSDWSPPSPTRWRTESSPRSQWGPWPGWGPGGERRQWGCNQSHETSQESHLEADDVAEEFAGSEAEHGDASDDSVLAEEAAEDHVPLPDVGQVPGQMFSLLTVVKMIIRTNLDSRRIWWGTGWEVRLSQGWEQWSSQSPTSTRVLTRLRAMSPDTNSTDNRVSWQIKISLTHQ